jgi:outer membrane protein OmpA-like peptidoglycan-associated protein/tetratricopeptide (TPR) repeat protein
MKSFIHSALFFCFVFVAYSQSLSLYFDTTGCPETSNEKARTIYQKTRDKKKYEKNERMKMLAEAIALDSNYVQASYYAAQEIVVKCKLDNKSFSPAIPLFMKVIENCPQYHSDPYYYVGFYFYEAGKYKEAEKYLQKYVKFTSDDDLKFSKDNEIQIYQAKEMIKYGKQYDALDNKTVPFNPKVVSGISSERDEYLAYISPDDQLALYTRRMPVQARRDQVFSTDKEAEVLTISLRNKNGEFDKGAPLEAPFNQAQNEGGPTLTIDNKHLYYTIYKQEGGTQPNADIYVSDFFEGAWSQPRKLGKKVNHPVYWDSQPSVSSDGTTVYFVSDRPGGLGGTDIYKTVQDPQTREWGEPINLGSKINSSGNERTPFIHPDNESFYFSSDGFAGYGALDIYFVKKESDGNWGIPQNMGKPINDGAENSGFFVSSNGRIGYFVSYDEGNVGGKGIGGRDLYQFELYKEAMAEEVAFLKGQVTDQLGQTLKGATVEIKDMVTKEKTSTVIDTNSGNYMSALKIRKSNDVLVTVKKEGHSFSSQVVKVKEVAEKVENLKVIHQRRSQKGDMDTRDKNLGKSLADDLLIPVEIKLEELSKGKSYNINSIYYKTNSPELSDDSFIVLDEFATYLKDNKTLKIEIQGHTDNVGKEADNVALSNNRAFTVKQYLEKKGIAPERLFYKGFGSAKPLAANTSEENKAKNRRTEFLLLEM